MPDKRMEKAARKLHDTYEKIAPDYGYTTRRESRVFDPESPNGRLMLAVCAKVVPAIEARARREALKAAAEQFPDWLNPKTQLVSVAPWRIRKTILALSRKGVKGGRA